MTPPGAELGALLRRSGRGSEAASRAYDVQLMKTYGQITTLRTTSNNPALSLVRSTDGRSIGRSYKLAKIATR